MLDPSAYTLGPANGSSSSKSPSSSPLGGGGGGGGLGQPPATRGERIIVHDTRWRFPDESQLPKPRPFQGGPRRYRAGRGSSVPLDLGLL